MKIYLVKRAAIRTNAQGIPVCEYRGYEGDHLFTSKKKAYAYIEKWTKNEWEHFLYHYEVWTNKKPFYAYKKIKYYSRIELHEIETN